MRERERENVKNFLSLNLKKKKKKKNIYTQKPKEPLSDSPLLSLSLSRFSNTFSFSHIQQHKARLSL